MNPLASLTVRIGADISSLAAEFRRVQAQTADLSRKLADIGSTLTTRVTLPILAFGAAAVVGAARQEQLAVAFSTMLGSAERAKTLLGELADFAASTPFELPEVQQAARSLLAFGFAAESIEGELRRIGDVASGVGAPIGDIATIYGKARVAGRLFAEDVNQLTERGIPVISELARQFGVSESEVKKLVEQGKVGFPELQRAFADMTSEGGRFAGLMVAQSQTTAGAFSNMRDAVTRALADIGAEIVRVAKLREVFVGISEAVADLAAAFMGLPDGVKATIVVVVGLAAAIGPLLVGLGALVAMAPLVGAAVTFMTGPFGVAIVAVGALVAAIIYFRDELAIIKQAVDNFEHGLRVKIVGAAADALSAVATFLRGLGFVVPGMQTAAVAVNGVVLTLRDMQRAAELDLSRGVSEIDRIRFAATDAGRAVEAFNQKLRDTRPAYLLSGIGGPSFAPPAGGAPAPIGGGGTTPPPPPAAAPTVTPRTRREDPLAPIRASIAETRLAIERMVSAGEMTPLEAARARVDALRHAMEAASRVVGGAGAAAFASYTAQAAAASAELVRLNRLARPLDYRAGDAFEGFTGPTSPLGNVKATTDAVSTLTDVVHVAEDALVKAGAAAARAFDRTRAAVNDLAEGLGAAFGNAAASVYDAFGAMAGFGDVRERLREAQAQLGSATGDEAERLREQIRDLRAQMNPLTSAWRSFGSTVSNVMRQMVADIMAAIVKALFLRLVLGPKFGIMGSLGLGGITSAISKAAQPGAATGPAVVTVGDFRMSHGMILASVRAGLEEERRTGRGPGTLGG